MAETLPRENAWLGYSRAKALLWAALIFALNSYLCKNLFNLEFSIQMGSIESSYITISRWAMDNWSDLTWFPLWYTGEAFHTVYQPGLHLAVAALATAAHLTPQHAYHLLTGLTYSASAVTLFALCAIMTQRLGFSILSALIYSLVSPVCFFSPLFRHDAGGWLLPRRYQILIHYGEGPHTTAVAMIPLVILILHAAVCRRNTFWIVLAPFALAAVALTNWPGSMGLAMAIAAFCLSQVGADQPVKWLSLIGIGVVAYLIACPWMPPSTLLAVIGNAQQSDGTALGVAQTYPVLVLAAGLCVLHLVFVRFRADRTFRFLTFFAVIAGIACLTPEFFGWRLLPQPARFQLEFDLACAGSLGWILTYYLHKFPRVMQASALIVLLLLAVQQTRTFRKYVKDQTRPIDISSTVEYRMSQAFASAFPTQRVFAPGNVSYWMNLFNDVPQVAGCCDQGVPSIAYRIATYAIYTGQNAGSHDTGNSLLWLRAYGANAVGTTGPHSTETYRPFWNWRKFDGVLPEVWHQEEGVIYRIPRKSTDPVRVIPRSSLLIKRPVSGLDTANLSRFVTALEDPAIPAPHFRWLNRHEALVDAEVRSGDVIYLQIGNDRGWHAEQNGQPRAMNTDALGMMYVSPQSTGQVQLHLIYDGGKEAVITRILQAIGLLSIAVVVLARIRRKREVDS